jgi:Fe-S cluster assembly protein SufD
MSESPQIVIRTKRTEQALPKDFLFTSEMVRIAGMSEEIKNYRLQAWEIFKNLPLPATTDEAWRRTDLKPMRLESFRIPAKDAYLDLLPVPENLLQPMTGDTHGGEVILLPGSTQVRVDPALAALGVVFTTLRIAEQEYPRLLEKVLGKVVPVQEGKFAGLAGALAQDGVFLYVPAGVKVDQPLHSLLWGPGTGLAHLSHILVYLEAGAEVTYVHESASPTETGGQSLHAGLVELFVGTGSNLHFVELQSWSMSGILATNGPISNRMQLWIGSLGQLAAT